jgi:transposase-like protein
MPKQLRSYTPEFKTQAVQLATQPGTTISQIARDRHVTHAGQDGIDSQLLGKWIKRDRNAANQRPAFTGRGNPRPVRPGTPDQGTRARAGGRAAGA